MAADQTADSACEKLPATLQSTLRQPHFLPRSLSMRRRITLWEHLLRPWFVVEFVIHLLFSHLARSLRRRALCIGNVARYFNQSAVISIPRGQRIIDRLDVFTHVTCKNIYGMSNAKHEIYITSPPDLVDQSSKHGFGRVGG